jgi:hypothetical protein
MFKVLPIHRQTEFLGEVPEICNLCRKPIRKLEHEFIDGQTDVGMRRNEWRRLLWLSYTL